MKLDSSATIWSSPESERAGRPLLVLLHGYGSHEGDLFQLSPRLPLGSVVASVRAPISENGGWAWYPLQGRLGVDPSTTEANAAADALLDWLDTLQYASVSLLGFSQGAAVSLQAMRRAPTRFTSVVALSGCVVDGDEAGDTELATLRPPVFWGRGTHDMRLPDSRIEATDAWLPQHSTPTVRIYEDLGHAISSDELTDISAFLRAN
jgi:phospholipase/carboxylesterase